MEPVSVEFWNSQTGETISMDVVEPTADEPVLTLTWDEKGNARLDGLS
jgi:hypothetical protein